MDCFTLQTNSFKLHCPPNECATTLNSLANSTVLPFEPILQNPPQSIRLLYGIINNLLRPPSSVLYYSVLYSVLYYDEDTYSSRNQS